MECCGLLEASEYTKLGARVYISMNTNVAALGKATLACHFVSRIPRTMPIPSTVRRGQDSVKPMSLRLARPRVKSQPCHFLAV